MIKKFLGLVLVLNSLTVSAQTKMVEVFLNMPDSLLLLLTNNDRMDLLDFAESKMTAKVTNRLDAKSTLDRLTDDYLHLTVTNISTLEMKLLPLANDTLPAVVVVKTVEGPAKDSVLKLYASDWSRELEVKSYLDEPQLDDYWTVPLDEMTAEEQELTKQLDPILIEISLSPESNQLTYRRSFGMLQKKDQPIMEKRLKPVTVGLKP